MEKNSKKLQKRDMNSTKKKENKQQVPLHLLIAEKNVEIRCRFIRGFLGCRKYISTFAKPDIIVSVTEEEIIDAYNELCGVKQSIRALDENTEYGDLEYTIAYTKIAEAMLSNNILLMHGAAISASNKCFIFTAPSGTGKTTHILNWLKTIPDTFVVNGDKPLIDVDKKLVYGTPWCGKEGMNTNTSVPLAGIIFLERGKNNSITPVEFKEMIPVYFSQIYIPTSLELAIMAYQLIWKLKDVPCYRLTCNMEEASAVVAYEGIRNSNFTNNRNIS